MSAPCDARAVYRRYAFALIGLVVLFSWPLLQMIRFSLQHDLYSHLLLIPLISGWFAWRGRAQLPPPRRGPLVPAVALLVLGAGLAALYVAGQVAGQTTPTPDTVALSDGALVALVIGFTLLILGPAVSRRLLFPLGFLLLLVPFPDAFTRGIDALLQHGSVVAADLMIRAVGTPIWRDNLTFRVPGIAIQVAPECSGIRSTLVLMITSLVAGQLLLRSVWRRTLFVLLVIPLGILRNGFRIFTIAELCVHIGPRMIDSPIHHKGGPLFFVLSLVPFLLVLMWLAKTEGRNAPAPGSPLTVHG